MGEAIIRLRKRRRRWTSILGSSSLIIQIINRTRIRRIINRVWN
jgi:hypothetical protein